MKTVPSFKNLILAAALSLGFASAAFAQTTASAAGTLGKNYLSLSYDHFDFDNSSVDAAGVSFELNQNFREGLDGFFGYSYSRTEKVAGYRVSDSSITLGGRAFLTQGAMKPYVEFGVGYTWVNARQPANFDSFGWGAGVGVEIAANSQLSFTPYVRYSDLTEKGVEGTWNYGVKTDYWFTSKFGLTAKIDRDDDKNMAYSLGANFRF